MLQGLSVVVIAIAALVRSRPRYGTGGRARPPRRTRPARRLRYRGQRLRQTRLERRRTLLGWSPGGVETCTVALVTAPDEMEQAAQELSGGGPTSYVVLRVDEGEGSSANRGRSLRMLIEDQHLLCRPPALAEREALEKGFEMLGVQTALHR